MGIIRSKPQVEYYNDSYHITDTFSKHNEWRQTMKQMEHEHGSFLYKQVNQPNRFGSQPYVIYAIHDKEMKQRIQNLSHDQPHVSACKCLFLFCARTDFTLRTEFPYLPPLSFFKRYFYDGRHSIERTKIDWASRHTYMALGFVIAACAEESIPCSPVDGFHIYSVASLLDLPYHLIPTAILAIGAED